ncbi:MAG TPA: Spy/CpxP family protein refolding chaperone [Pseudolabrys sp.]|nr:Spy/CpxP family protein refolding chaperone [Pseudolabrys sp.]
MNKHSGWVAATLLATALTLPVAAGAQDKKNQPAAAAPHPAAAPHVAAPHVAAPPHIAAAPHVAAPQRAAVPHFSAPQHVAVPHVSAPQRAAVPQFTPRQASVPHVAPRHEAIQHVSPRNTVSHVSPSNIEPHATVQNRVAPTAQSNTAAAHVQSLSPAAQRRADRLERRHEQRVLRSLPPSQRAAKREEFRQQREQRLNAGNTTPTQSNAVVQSNAATRSGALAQQRNARRNGGTALTAQAARQGRFASRFGSHTRTANAEQVAAHRAWHHHHRAAFVGWYGPVFWPYAYSDIFDYAFWPDGYDAGYWDYAYDSFFDGMFWGEQGPPADYVYAEPTTGSAPTRVSHAGVQELCNEPGSGITSWPFADITGKVGLNAEQKSLLGQMRTAAGQAAVAFKASCPAENAFPLTPPGRLTAMTARLDAMLKAVDIVRPALDAFYNSLSDEQKERFNELGPAPGAIAATGAETTGSVSQSAESCKQPKPGLANLPINRIEDVVKPTDDQEAGLDKLQAATEKAVTIMQAACPDETPLTPTGRLEAMQKRLQAMIDAANTVQPALADFYGSLSNEQKARFNRIGQELAKSNG